MEMQQLQNFYVIAQCESLTKAAQRLHTSQPSLSRSLHSLEDELGAPLFDRVGRNIVLNDTGRFALTKVLNVLNSAESIKLDVSEFTKVRIFLWISILLFPWAASKRSSLGLRKNTLMSACAWLLGIPKNSRMFNLTLLFSRALIRTKSTIISSLAKKRSALQWLKRILLQSTNLFL